MTTLTASSIRDRALAYLTAAGLTVLPDPCEAGDESCVRGWLDVHDLAQLDADAARWQRQPILSAFHADLGPHRREWRSWRNDGYSVQVVANPEDVKLVGPVAMCRVYADVDRYNPEQDLVNLVGHGFGEVLPDETVSLGRTIGRWFKRLLGR